jgi:hypothetical protein
LIVPWTEAVAVTGTDHTIFAPERARLGGARKARDTFLSAFAAFARFAFRLTACRSSAGPFDQ